MIPPQLFAHIRWQAVFAGLIEKNIDKTFVWLIENGPSDFLNVGNFANCEMWYLTYQYATSTIQKVIPYKMHKAHFIDAYKDLVWGCLLIYILYL